MVDYSTHTSAVEAGDEADSLIAGKSLAFYWRASRFFIVVLAAATAACEIYEVSRYIRWGSLAVICVLFCSWLIVRFNLKLATVLAAAVYLGAITGLVVALFDIVWYHQWWYLLNIIRKPFILGGISVVAGFVTYLVLQSIRTRGNAATPKGGGTYGRTKKPIR
ncbi:MAG: hypothetical protein WC505_00490 [Patescibacteria group bacterium]